MPNRRRPTFAENVKKSGSFTPLTITPYSAQRWGHSSTRFAQQRLQKANRHGETDARRLTHCGVLRSLQQSHVDDADDLTGFCVVKRTAAVARICRSIQLE